MKKVNVYDLPLAFNICDQMLRELERIPAWSMAHVVMNSKAWALLHEHHVTEEVYIITKGSGNLTVGQRTFSVQAGDAIWIPTYTPHSLVNTSAASLEHFVLAAPPFDPKDVHVIDSAERTSLGFPIPFLQPSVVECFDGAKIIAYDFADIVSVAFGWVINDPGRHKPAHYHKKTTEWIFVVEGTGFLELNSQTLLMRVGDWICVEPGELHALRNYDNQHMVVVCICNPHFSMHDVYYR